MTSWDAFADTQVLVLRILQDTEGQGALEVKNPPANAGDIESCIQSLHWEALLEKDMATHSSILAWRIPWTEELGGLQP